MTHNTLVSLFYPVVFYKPCLDFEWDLIDRISIAINLPAYTLEYIDEHVKGKVLGRDEADYLSLERQGLELVQDFLEACVSQRAKAIEASEGEKWVVSKVSRIILTSNFTFARILYRITSNAEELRPRFLTAWIGWVRKMGSQNDYKRLVEGLFASLLYVTVNTTVDFFRNPFKSFPNSPMSGKFLSETRLHLAHLYTATPILPSANTSTIIRISDVAAMRAPPNIGTATANTEEIAQPMYVAPESPSVPGTSVDMRSELKDPSTCPPAKHHRPSAVLPLSEVPRSPLRSVQNIAVETPAKSKPKPSPKRPSSGSRKKQRVSLSGGSDSKAQFVVPLLPGADLENMDG